MVNSYNGVENFDQKLYNLHKRSVELPLSDNYAKLIRIMHLGWRLFYG